MFVDTSERSGSVCGGNEAGNITLSPVRRGLFRNMHLERVMRYDQTIEVALSTSPGMIFFALPTELITHRVPKSPSPSELSVSIYAKHSKD